MIARARPIRTRPARGLTLLELLVVIFIISILLAVAIPVFRPPVQERAIREAARMVNSAFAIARTKALETGDSWGVMFDPLENAPAGCKTLHYVKVPPPYAGDTVNSRLIIRAVTVLAPPNQQKATLRIELPQNDLLATTATAAIKEDDNVRPGDMLLLNYAGHRYQVLDVRSAGGNLWDIDVHCDTVVVWPRVVHSDYTVEPSQAFQFTHLPTKASLAPVQLPALAAVDIDMSGIGSGTFDPSRTIPVIVTFAPSGELDLVYYYYSGSAEVVRPSESLHMLIGKPGAYGAENLADLGNIWVSIGSHSGQLTSAENAVVLDRSAEPYVVVAPDPAVAAEVYEARTYARRQRVEREPLP